MKARLAFLLVFLLPTGARSEEDFPGQNNLAAGMACHRNLDTECARSRLETALSEFSPEKDPHYLDHVRMARMVLALLHVAADDLDKAEAEFKTLLLLDPDFVLPEGDHPPKVRYVFERAKDAVEEEGKPPPPPEAEKPNVVKKPETPEKPKVTKKENGDRIASKWLISVEGRWVGLFGDDAKAVGSGPGAALAFGFQPNPSLILGLGYGYAYHPSAQDGPALQAMSLEAEALAGFDWSSLRARLGGGLGVLAMGTEDRYDHWGFVIRATVALAWPARGRWALIVSLRPSMVFTGGGTSFYLPVGLAGEIRW